MYSVANSLCGCVLRVLLVSSVVVVVVDKKKYFFPPRIRRQKRKLEVPFVVSFAVQTSQNCSFRSQFRMSCDSSRYCARASKIIVVYCRLLMSITGVVGLEMLRNTSRKIYNSTAMLEACDIIIAD